MNTVVAAPRVTRGLGWYFLRLGTLGFGGPIALVGAMHRDLVEQRGWISEEEYREGIALAQLSPGPLAAQLCFYIGFVRGRIAGATLAGLSFVLPSFLMVLALGWAYTLYQGLPWMQAVFYGVAAAVIGLISRSAWLLTLKTIGRDTLLWGIYLLVAVATIATGRELVGLILLGGFATWLWRVPPAWLRRTGTAAEAGLLLQIAAFFAYAGSFVFGSGLAIVPFLHGGVVLQHGWLTERQFIDAVAVAFITPGPVVIIFASPMPTVPSQIVPALRCVIGSASETMRTFVLSSSPSPPWVTTRCPTSTPATICTISGSRTPICTTFSCATF